MTLKKEVYIEKRGYEGKNRAEVKIREKMFRGGAGPWGVQNHSFYGSFSVKVKIMILSLKTRFTGGQVSSQISVVKCKKIARQREKQTDRVNLQKVQTCTNTPSDCDVTNLRANVSGIQRELQTMVL
jgi:hypothetical protein